MVATIVFGGMRPALSPRFSSIIARAGAFALAGECCEAEDVVAGFVIVVGVMAMFVLELLESTALAVLVTATGELAPDIVACFVPVCVSAIISSCSLLV